MVIAAIVGALVVRRVCRQRLDRSGHVGHGQQWGNDSRSVYFCFGSVGAGRRMNRYAGKPTLKLMFPTLVARDGQLTAKNRR